MEMEKKIRKNFVGRNSYLKLLPRKAVNKLTNRKSDNILKDDKNT